MQADVAFWTSLVQYLNNVGDAADGLHNAIGSFYMWAWDANADDTFHSGGLVASDWETLNWQKLGALIGNNTEFTYGLDLIPWYLPGYILPTGKTALRCAASKRGTSCDMCDQDCHMQGLPLKACAWHHTANFQQYLDVMIHVCAVSYNNKTCGRQVHVYYCMLLCLCCITVYCRVTEKALRHSVKSYSRLPWIGRRCSHICRGQRS